MSSFLSIIRRSCMDSPYSTKRGFHFLTKNVIIKQKGGQSMDQVKIGKFIASERKQKGYTQMELAQRLGISNKTVSKWERGNGFPDISLLLPLCEELEISVNELITGERIAEADYRNKAEENMVNIIDENKKSVEERIISAVITLALVIVVAIGGVLLRCFTQPEVFVATGIMVIVSTTCMVAIWISVTIMLRKGK